MNNPQNRVWYAPDMDIKSPDAIHQILMFGTLGEIKSLKKEAGLELLRDVFLKHPKKIYTPAAFHFIKYFILEISTPTDDQKYLKSTPRNTR